jgi:hypothetical protein
VFYIVSLLTSGANDSGDAGTHLSIRFSKASTSSLLVHRLKLDVGECKGRQVLLLSRLIAGHRPTIRYKVNPVDKEDTTIHESRFFPNAPDVIYLHAHSGSSPYLPSRPSGFDIDIYQDVACPVRQASLSIDWGSSLAKMVTRYRMAALAWIIGWVAHLMVGSVTFVEITGG